METKHTKHTPGPWKYDYRKDGNAKRFDAEILDSNGYNLATLGAHPDLLTTVRSDEEMQANAELIAAAPETAKERDELKEENEALENEILEKRNSIETLLNKLGNQNNELFALKQLNSELLALDNPWPLDSVLKKLIDATHILLNQKSYDGHDYEEMETAIKRSYELLKTISKAKGQIN